MPTNFASLALLLPAALSSPEPITNETYRPAALVHLNVDSAFIHIPGSNWWYSHHPHIASLGGKLVVIWSNGVEGEDKPGQRVLGATSSDFFHWSEPTAISTPGLLEGVQSDVLTAGGLFNAGDHLIAYVSAYSKDHTKTRLAEFASFDGSHWGAPSDTGLAVTPNVEPKTTRTGRLIMTGNFLFPYTTDPLGVGGWKVSGLPTDNGHLEDNPAKFAEVSHDLRLPVEVCEGSFFQTDDGVIHMMLRSTGPGWHGRLWESQSADDGSTWSKPRETEFSDNDAKFVFGRLPDGRFYYVGNPDPNSRGTRKRLVLSLSSDGVNFTQHYLIADKPYKRLHSGSGKRGQYGYPDTLIENGNLYVVVSRKKEAIQVFRIRLDQLSPPPNP